MPAHPTFPANLFSPCAALAGDCEGKLRQYKIQDHCIGLHFSAGLKSSKEGSPLTSVDCNNAPMWSFTKDRFEYQRTGLCMSFSAESIALNPTLNQGDFTRVVLKRCDKNDLGQQFEYKDGMIRWHQQESTNDLCMETEGCSTDVGAQLRLWGGCDRNSECYAISTGACDRDEKGGEPNQLKVRLKKTDLIVTIKEVSSGKTIAAIQHTRAMKPKATAMMTMNVRAILSADTPVASLPPSLFPTPNTHFGSSYHNI